jgi:peptide/nickel transport system ATP-binding protein/oligopeptide transport system ATP-binding protein
MITSFGLICDETGCQETCETFKTPTTQMPPLLEIKNLKTAFETNMGAVRAVDDVTFSIGEGEVLGLVGESGCGKSITALSILRLIAAPGQIVGGSIKFKGRNLLECSPEEMRSIRGNDIAMIFQDPLTSLNPVYTVGEQIAEAIRLHRGLDRTSAWASAIDAMKEVAIPDAERRASDYPHQLSGGMRQRVMIAMALACDPELLIADEPTTALDVTIQAQILDLINGLRSRRKLSVLLITHDLGVIAETADRVAVMYTGRIVEEGSVAQLFSAPKHPYTRGLLNSLPEMKPSGGLRLETIEGSVPNPSALPDGCHFAPRCRHAVEQCLTGEMELIGFPDGSAVRCPRSIEM